MQLTKPLISQQSYHLNPQIHPDLRSHRRKVLILISKWKWFYEIYILSESQASRYRRPLTPWGKYIKCRLELKRNWKWKMYLVVANLKVLQAPFLQVFHPFCRCFSQIWAGFYASNLTETPAKRVKHLQNGSLQDFWGGAAKGPLSGAWSPMILLIPG